MVSPVGASVVLRLSRRCVKRLAILLVVVIAASWYLLTVSPPRLMLSQYSVVIKERYGEVYLWVNASGYITPPKTLLSANDTLKLSLRIGDHTMPIGEVHVVEGVDMYDVEYVGGVRLPVDVENLTAITSVKLDAGLKGYEPYPPSVLTSPEQGHWLLVFYSPYLLNVTVNLYVLPVDPAIEIHNEGWGFYKCTIEVHGVDGLASRIEKQLPPGSTVNLSISGIGIPVFTLQEVSLGPFVFTLTDGRLALDLGRYIAWVIAVEASVLSVLMLVVCRKRPRKRK
ncbi:hypothetical protein [Desulfurococcus mucosus]|uniref:hypothetical protein n=1 Tax=Desulfurococcus mucosus TaxID=2275 RepID=UPI0006623AFB|nr:hypothetical protein [Desulfurococcus mucosus]